MPARAALRLLPPTDDTVPVPAGLLREALDNAAALADDLFDGIDGVARRIYIGNRAAALNELGRLHHRVEDFADDFAALDPHPDRGPSNRRPA